MLSNVQIVSGVFSRSAPVRGSVALLLASVLMANISPANAITLSPIPLLTAKSAPGLVMLTMGRDLSFSKAAYNDVSDIDGDGAIDLHFKPQYKYEGYFANDRCYIYSGSVAAANFKASTLGTVVHDASDSSKDYTTCGGTLWSGNFLNWVTMARIDVLRKVLYGGKRSTDTGSTISTTGTTILERTYVPQDSTLWGKEYTSVANDGYNIADFTPLALPTGISRHFFINVSLSYTSLGNATTPPTKIDKWSVPVSPPMMIVYKNQPMRLWDLAASEKSRLTAVYPATSVFPGSGSTVTAPATTISRYNARVEVCKVPLPTALAMGGTFEDSCTGYTNTTTAVTTYKPTGLLHRYGESKQLAFGLLTGTDDQNFSGGVVRQNIDDFNREVTPTTGVFTTVKGIVFHMNTIRPWSMDPDNGWATGVFDRLVNEGYAMAWGNPLGEMMFEGLKYFAGGSKTNSFSWNVFNYGSHGSDGALGEPARLQLQSPAWANPYAAVASTVRKNAAAYPICARPIQMTIGDPKTSFDSDQLPGSVMTSSKQQGKTSDANLEKLDVATEADEIWKNEFGKETVKKFFIGEAPGNADGNPSAKEVSSFSNIRGHAPDATTNQGSYLGASVARFGKFTGLVNSAIPSTTSGKPLLVEQISVALDSHVPKIKIPMPDGKTVTILPLSKTVYANSTEYKISHAKGDFQQTGAITGFFIEQMANTDATNINAAVNNGKAYYKFRISYSDTDMANDNESDAKVSYEIKVNSANELSIGMSYFEASNGIEMHQGYVISGTTSDGLYLDVAGAREPGSVMPPPPEVGYFLDTKPGEAPGSAMNKGNASDNYTTITNRLPLSTLSAPRTFTAGTGDNGELVPHDMLWYAAKYGGAVKDAEGKFNFKYTDNGVDPDNYFLVSDPSKMPAQLGKAFQKAAALTTATSAGLAGSGARVGAGSFVYQASYDTIQWGGELRAYGVDAEGAVSDTATWQATDMQPIATKRTMVLGGSIQTFGALGVSPRIIDTLSYPTLTTTGTVSEQTAFRDAPTFQYLLGDRAKEESVGGKFRNRIKVIGDIVNSDPIYIGTADFGYSDSAYTSFKANNPELLGVGSNDGFYRILSAKDGAEKLAFVPFATRDAMKKLADPAYSHQYYVDGSSSFGHVLFDAGNSSASWRSVVSASLGAGGKSLFAIDVTSASTSSLSESNVLWEYGADDDLGNILNKPIVGMLSDGTTPVVIVGNGPNSNNDKAVLFVFNAKTGEKIRTCTPSASFGNGLGSTAFVSEKSNGNISYVYGADYLGNIWRFDPNDKDCGTNSILIFSAVGPVIAPATKGVKQPITGEITVIPGPVAKGGYIILFGTGSYLSTSDPASTAVQTLYGVWDDLGVNGYVRADLAKHDFVTPSKLAGTRSTDVISVTNPAWFESKSKVGWYLDLTCSDSALCMPGERMVSKPAIIGSRAYFLSFVPGTDPCTGGGGGWLTGFDAITGGYTKGFGSLDENSMYIEGAVPRGIFPVKRTATASNPTTDIILISITYNENNPEKNSHLDSTGAKFCGNDGSCTKTGSINGGSNPDPAIDARRQVWRQIQ